MGNLRQDMPQSCPEVCRVSFKSRENGCNPTVHEQTNQVRTATGKPVQRFLCDSGFRCNALHCHRRGPAAGQETLCCGDNAFLDNSLWDRRPATASSFEFHVKFLFA